MLECVPECEKLTFSQVRDIIDKYHQEHDIHYVSDRKVIKPLVFRVVFDPFASGWSKYKKYPDDEGNIVDDLTHPITYTLESCTYEFNDCDKYWFGECGGNSLFAHCLNKDELDSSGIRLDYYLGDWKILYCYQVKQEKEEK